MWIDKKNIFYLMVGVSLTLNAEIIVNITHLQADKIKFTMSNKGNYAASFLAFQTPLYDISANFFVIERQGKELSYTGKLGLWLPPTDEDWVELKPNEVITSEICLSQYYSLDKDGIYTVKFQYPVQINYDSREKVKKEHELQSNQVSFSIHHVLCSVSEPMALAAIDQNGCTGLQEDIIKEAFYDGASISYAAVVSLGIEKPHSKYEKWFGKYSEDNYSKVQSNFQKIQDSFTSRWEIKCVKQASCKPKEILYVYADQPYKVWICDLFHLDEVKNFRGTFLLHEASHWKAAAATQDHECGVEKCKNLAKTSPQNAIQNAYNYEYFTLDIINAPEPWPFAPSGVNF